MYKKKNKVIKLLNKLVTIFKEWNIVRKILQAKDYKEKNKVIKLLNELVTNFKERNTVRKILQAKDLKVAYEEEKAAMSEQLESFMLEVKRSGEYPISDASEVISADDVVEVCFILLMSGVDDCDLIDEWESMEGILNQVQEDDLQEIAGRLIKFLYDDDCADCFSEWTEDELLKKLLL